MALPAPRAFRELWEAVASETTVEVPALPESALPFFLARLPAPKSGKSVVAVFQERAELSLTAIARASAVWRTVEVADAPPAALPVLTLPLLLPQERSGEIPTPRLRAFWQALESLREGDPRIILATPRELRQPAPAATTELGGLILTEGQTLTPVAVAAKLLELGYHEEKDATEPGTFARRGGLLDIFAFHAAAPVRLEYGGDIIDRIRQVRRVRENGNGSGMTEDQLEVVYARVTAAGKARVYAYPLGLPKKLPTTVQGLLGNAIVIAEEGALPKTKAVHLLFQPFDKRTSPVTEAPTFGGETKKLATAVREALAANAHVYFLTARPRSLALELKKSTHLHLLPVDAAADARGFSVLPEKLHVWTDADLGEVPAEQPLTWDTGMAYARRLSPNDYVVHRDHGIARFRGIERKTFGAAPRPALGAASLPPARDYLILEYAQRDRLFVPVELASKVTPYVGAANPIVHRLGGPEWETTTAAVRAEASDLAKELLALYASRAVEGGTAFPPDTAADRKLAESFPYEETPDQTAAIREVKLDMERAQPMDRLVSGDVGFGKTEVAIRAAYKALNFGRQVAVLSPTTLLAQQHADTFKERLAASKARVALLSRFQTPAEEGEILAKLSAGQLDIVIGTHRLLSPDVQFKNLGLVIIDEEQKFGVEQKETLKKFRSTVDVLSLSATPIPRTLHMALSGLRSLSVIATAPKARRAVITKVTRENDALVAKALEDEVARGGQAYVLWNRVETIEAAAERIRTLVPQARVVVAHGQMPEDQLMRVMEQFDTKRADVLVCSTIIENGIDLPNVNTLVVFDAPSFGLADLYQLRGRVGRGDRQAYAYFLYTQGKLPFEARKRLAALLEAVALGSGWTLALRDLEIRGAGNLLGREQHGSIRAVGIHLFGELIKEEVEKLRSGKPAVSTADVQVDLPVRAFLPEEYIPNLEARLAAYARFSVAGSPADLAAARRALEEHYGPLPADGMRFLRLFELKFLAVNAGIASITESSVQGGPRPPAAPGSQERRVTITFREGLTPALAYAAIADNPRWVFTGTTMSMATNDVVAPRSKKLGTGNLGEALIAELAHILKVLGDAKRKEAAGTLKAPKPQKG